jgi:hypothetical protein
MAALLEDVSYRSILTIIAAAKAKRARQRLRSSGVQRMIDREFRAAARAIASLARVKPA